MERVNLGRRKCASIVQKLILEILAIPASLGAVEKGYFYCFCFSRNIIVNLKMSTFFSTIFRTILNNSDILFGSDCKRGNKISQAADDNSILVRWNERVVIFHSYADVIEMKRANVRNCAFVAPSY